MLQMSVIAREKAVGGRRSGVAVMQRKGGSPCFVNWH
jgi:hypothetical protein